MADYRTGERPTEPRHCGSTKGHGQHTHHVSGHGRFLCTGNRGLSAGERADIAVLIDVALASGRIGGDLTTSARSLRSRMLTGGA